MKKRNARGPRFLIHISEARDAAGAVRWYAAADHLPVTMIAPTRRGALRRTLKALRKKGYRIRRGDYTKHIYPHPTGPDKQPMLVMRNRNRPGEFYAELSGAPHLRGFGRTPSEAEASCREYLQDQGLGHLIGDVFLEQ